jgi:sulfite reductase alpha subunit-like flavoprotein
MNEDVVAIHFNLAKEVIDKKVFYGLCSFYLAGLSPSDQDLRSEDKEDKEGEEDQLVYVSLEKAGEKFRRLLEDSSRPVLYVSAGTGFAPIRSFLHGNVVMNLSFERLN